MSEATRAPPTACILRRTGFGARAVPQVRSAGHRLEGLLRAKNEDEVAGGEDGVVVGHGEVRSARSLEGEDLGIRVAGAGLSHALARKGGPAADLDLFQPQAGCQLGHVEVVEDGRGGGGHAPARSSLSTEAGLAALATIVRAGLRARAVSVMKTLAASESIAHSSPRARWMPACCRAVSSVGSAGRWGTPCSSSSSASSGL